MARIFCWTVVLVTATKMVGGMELGPRPGLTLRGGKTIDPRGTPLVEKAARPLVALAKKYEALILENPKMELYIQLGGTVVALQLVNALIAKHGKKARVILFCRLAYVLFLVVHQWALVAVQERILAADDTSPVTIPVNPMLEALAKRGQQEDSPLLQAKETTVKEYDLDMVKKGRHAETGAVAVMAYLHLKRGYLQPLVVSTVMGFLALLKNPLIQIHLFGRDPVGPLLTRPFKPPVPAWLKAIETHFGPDKTLVETADVPSSSSSSTEEEDDDVNPEDDEAADDDDDDDDDDDEDDDDDFDEDED